MASTPRRARPRPSLEQSPAPVTDGLEGLLADSFQCYRDTHLAHFNVTGPLFPQLHQLFEEQYREMWDALDAIAERVRALGPRVASRAFSVEADSLPEDAAGMLQHLARQHRALARTCAGVERAATQAEDTPTADLANERRLAHEKHAWMLEATSSPASPDTA